MQNEENVATMSVEFMMNEIKKRESKKVNLFSQLLKECDEIIQKLSVFRESPTSFRPVLPDGVIGRRLTDKISHLEKTIEEFYKSENPTLNNLEKIQKSIFLVIQHLKFHKKIYPLDEEIQMPSFIQDLKTEFAVLHSVESNFKASYIEYCASELKKRALKTKDRLVVSNLKDTFNFYVELASKLSYQSISRLKSINDEYNDILNPSFIAREYKILEEQLWKTKEGYQDFLSQREKLKESAKHLTHLEKCQKKSATYLEEIDKYVKKLDVVHEDSIHEIEDLISSYQEAHKIMEEEIVRIKIFIQNEYNISDIDEYHKMSSSIQIKIANTEIELKSLEKKSLLFEEILSDIQPLRKKSEPKHDSEDDLI
jgi:hypothetical protein